MERLGDYMLARLAKAQRSRDQWRDKFHHMQASRDYWKSRTRDLQLKLEQATTPRMVRGRYVTEEDRLEARRRTFRDSQRRRKLRQAA